MRHVVEGWFDPSNNSVHLRVDKGTEVSSLVGGIIQSGTADMKTVSWGDVSFFVAFKNHLPNATERDAIASYAGTRNGQSI
jgi:hypothetical protein